MKLASPCLFVVDVARTLQFYKCAFNAQEKFYDPEFGFAMIVIGGSEIGIASHAAGEQMMKGNYPFSDCTSLRGIELAFFSQRVDEDYKTAINAGAVPLAPPYDTEWGQRVAYVKSVEGTVIGICSELES